MNHVELMRSIIKAHEKLIATRAIASSAYQDFQELTETLQQQFYTEDPVYFLIDNKILKVWGSKVQVLDISDHEELELRPFTPIPF